jgi:hypothetical protein
MSPGASSSSRSCPQNDPDRQGGAVWLVAILFAALSVISFAIDQSITLSPPPEPPSAHDAR